MTETRSVDTPETKHPKKPVQWFGREASTFTRLLVEGKTVRLEFDPENAHRHHRDRHGRLLAYVYLPDGRLLNLEIIGEGYGFAYTAFPFAQIEEFRAAQKEARERRRGCGHAEGGRSRVVRSELLRLTVTA